MRIYDVAFYIAIFFILGIFMASVLGGFVHKWLLVAVLVIFVAGAFWIGGRRRLAVFSLMIFIGAVYYFILDARAVEVHWSIGEKTRVEGVVRKVETTERGQEIFLDSVKIYAQRYPSFEYGDLISAEGAIKQPDARFRDLFLKDGIAVTMSYPDIKVIETGRGNILKSWLFKLRSKVLDIFMRSLPPESARFLAGITLGEKSVFSKSFREELSRSGTSHLVALSGYNITVIIEGVALLLATFFGRRGTFIATLTVIGFFVMMTGAEASIVRAAFMGGILLLADQVGRIYSFRNAITLVAFFMVLQNPKILVFDLGFQLSFLALLGIVYIRPIVARAFDAENAESFLDWKKNFQTTLSAQIAVLPLIVKTFGSFSFNGLISNVLILPTMPYAMFMGFLVGVAGFISDYLAFVFGFLANLLISWQLYLIKFFGAFGYAEGISISWFWVFLYYAAIAGIVYYFRIYAPRK